jgi:glycosyltransferase involved in cell wall biosynthesis
MKYVMVLLVPFYRVDENTIACEGAFYTHLKELLPRISEWGDEILIHSPVMSTQTYTDNKHHLAHIDCAAERIDHVASYASDISRAKFMLHAPFSIWPKIWQVVKSANVVHSSVSKDIFKLFTFLALFFAVLQGKKTVTAMDIDHRNSAKMSYRTGKFSYKSYFLSQYIYNPIISLQIRFVSRFCNLVMLKGQLLVDDYGKGRAKVKNFYDTAHDESFVLSEQDMAQKLQYWDSSKSDIKCVYFGRLVDYKGIDDMILAVKKAAEKLQEMGSKKTISLSIIGTGESEHSLKALVDQHELQGIVEFCGALSYGEALFSRLREYDFLLAAPHSEDTPRSVFDAMACGLPMIAYDTYYYKDLEATDTVKTVPWLSIDALADGIVTLSHEPERVQKMIKKCRDFAVNNTQEAWLNKRLAWTKEFLS